MKTKKILFFILTFIICIHFSWSQSKTISGTVSDNTGVLPGVSISIKGTSKGTQSDFDGKYTINANIGDILQYSYVGMITVEIKVADVTTINLILKGNTQLEEVVIVGYGKQSKRKLTDNISTITSDKIGGVPTPSLQGSLTAKAAGVQVTQINGKVEGGVKIRVRGISTIGASQEPLYVVDGVPIITSDESSNGSPINPLISLNPNDIESIQILKDASSAAIYGARGSNGVVLITTKQGKKGKTRISLNISNGFSKATNKRDWLNTAQYIELFEEAALNEGFTLAELRDEFTFSSFDQNAVWDPSLDTDWQELALVTGHSRDYSVAASGGNEKTTFYTSIAHNDTKGIVRGNKLKRYNFRTNINHKASEKLDIGLNASISKTLINRVSDDNQFSSPVQVIAQAPLTAPYNVDGSANRSTLYYNFLIEEQNGNFETNIWRTLSNIYAQYNFSENFNFRSEVGYDNNNQVAERFSGRLTESQSTNGFAYANSSRTEKYVLNNYVTFFKNVNDKHDFEAILGVSYEKSTRKFQSVQGTEFPSDDLQTLNSAGKITAGGSSETGFSFLSYFARATYSIDDKYLLKFSIRRDGSSRFGEKNRFGWFPAASAGWIISEEEFLNDSKTISQLKLRASWGITGNAGIDDFAALSLFGGSPYNQRGGLTPTQLGNPDLNWEQTSQFDIGIDFGFFNNVLTGELDYYKKTTNDLLLQLPVPGTSGFSTINRNVGSMQNTGAELVLNTKNISSYFFSWDTNFNVSYNKNEVTKLPGGTIIESQNIVEVGETIASFFMAEYAGVDPNNGDAIYYLNTLNPDGSRNRTTTNDYGAAERIIAGSPFPNLIAGLTNTVSYKNIDFSLTFQGEFGASIYNVAGRFQATSGDFFDNQTVDQLDRWQNPGDITNIPQARLFAGNGTGHSTRYLQKTDFIRLRNITLGYSLPSSVLKRINLDRFRIYATGLNLLTITNYDGYDPESTADVNGQSNIIVGEEFFGAPAAKTITIGINVDF